MLKERRPSAPRSPAGCGQKPWIVPIPAKTERSRLEENIGAARLDTTVEVLREIESPPP